MRKRRVKRWKLTMRSMREHLELAMLGLTVMIVLVCAPALLALRVAYYCFQRGRGRSATAVAATIE
jgi:hypothetical protein